MLPARLPVMLLNGRPLDYLVITHMEPDHAAAVGLITKYWPDVKILCSLAASRFLDQFGFCCAAASAAARARPIA